MAVRRRLNRKRQRPEIRGRLFDLNRLILPYRGKAVAASDAPTESAIFILCPSLLFALFIDLNHDLSGGFALE